MNIRTFKGGTHPPERKDATRALAVESLAPSSNIVWIPVTQGGAPNRPVVAVGDSVARGQIIAESDAPMAVPVHASIAGKVSKIETRLVAGNIEVLCIGLEADGSTRETFLPPLDPATCSREDALARVRAAGLVGMGGAAFPAHVKLNPPSGTKIDWLIANGAECEPYLTCDYRTLAEHASAVVDGLAIAMRIVGATRGVLAVEDNKADLVPSLEAAIAALPAGLFPESSAASSVGASPISVVLCRTKYPQGGEKMLIKAITGREVPSGGLPANAGCVVHNVGTLKALSEAFRLGKPLIDRTLTVSGGACANPKNIEVPIGTLVGDLIPAHFTLKPGVAKIIAGGPMMGIAMKNANFPIVKNTSGVLFLTKAETVLTDESACIGCGSCLRACSCRLAPVLMIRALALGNLAEADRCGLMDCVECGACAYVCPARIKLVQRIKIGKQQLREERAARKAKELARAKHTEAAPAASKETK